jgi:two-component system OmpR family response regulator
MSSNDHVLVVDDDPNITNLLDRLLSKEGYQVSVAATAAEMRVRVKQSPPNIIILDLMLPDGDGFSLAREVCADIDCGLIMLTGKADIVDKIVGLEVGADDYITKPFDNKEFLARVKSVLRRTSQTKEKEPIENNSIAHFNGWKLDMSAQELTSPEEETVHLTSYEYLLLDLFVKKANKVFTRDQIMNAMTDRDWSPIDRSIDVLVSKLRQKLNEDMSHPALIKTIRGAGYKFTTTVEFS